MTRNIYSSLNLTKCLKDFQEQVTKILEKNNIPQWNGRTFKAHEEKIREGALIWMNLLLQH
ncbi:conserved hypothetical protein ['Nostoc azollae' 0708]|jgi:hypothetical protein|uniref:Uncharacterized protein n=1 Tax=Nostoc azollae (strain 0708) TaxID=551115 RepID=D7DWB4_NOSA0|nr:conserved hypothetical protein ['Nostoc azollae' 0708]